jgi:hypothetical protein
MLSILGWLFIMFGKSFSNEAVEIAVKYIRLFDENPDAFFDLHEPQKLVQSLPNLQYEISDFRDTYNKDNKDSVFVRLSFGLGVISAITQYFFDGKTKHMAAYERTVVISAFNRGFLINLGKSTYKTYSNPKYKGSQFYWLGQLWGKKYYIDKFIQSGASLNEATKLLEANVQYQEMKFYDPERALEIASEAGISVKEHLDWCNSFVLRIEKEFENNGEFNSDFLSYLSTLEGNLDSLRKSRKIYYISSNYTIEEIYRAMNKILSREMHPELVEFFDNGYTCAKVSNLETSLDEVDENDDINSVPTYAPTFNIDKRYEKYLELWEFEQNRPQSKIFSEAFSERTSKLDFKNFDFRKIEEGQFKEALKLQFQEDLEFIFEIFGLTYHLLKDQNINAKIGFKVPCDPVLDDEITSYPEYIRQPFFGLKNEIIANENNFSFQMVGQNFPIFGRSIVHSNLSLNISIKFERYDDEFEIDDDEFETNGEWSDLMELDLSIASKFTHEEILDKDFDSGSFYLAQELKSISRELERKFVNSGPNYFKRLPDLIEDWKSKDYHFKSNEREVYNHLIAHQKELKDDDLQQDALYFFNHEDFVVSTHSPSDINWDAIFSIYSNSNERRSELMDEHGYFYDDFELEQLERFSRLGVPINPQQLRKGLGVLPVSIKIAMRMERLFAQLGDKHYDGNNFKNLLYSINERG